MKFKKWIEEDEHHQAIEAEDMVDTIVADVESGNMSPAEVQRSHLSPETKREIALRLVNLEKTL